MFHRFSIPYQGRDTNPFFTFILIIWGVFTPALDDGFPPKSEWQQVSSNLQNSSRYSGWSKKKKCCYLDGLNSSSYF